MMIDFTNYTREQLAEFLNIMLRDKTNPIYSPDDNNKIIGEPIYKCGIGLDTESTTITHVDDKAKKTVVDSCFCYTYQVSVGKNAYAIYRHIDKLIVFFKVLNQILKAKNDECMRQGVPCPKCIVWVANLSHEWSFLKYRMCDEFTLQKCFAKTARDVLYCNFGRFELKECIGLFGHSLADIAKHWCTTQKLKGDLDYNLVRHAETPLTEKEKQYCINDVIILAEMHEKVIETYMQENGGVILPTTSNGFLRMKLKAAIRDDNDLTDERNYYNDLCKPRNKPDIKTNLAYVVHQNHGLFYSQYQWETCRTYGYCGGLCGSNIDYVGTTLHNVQCVDLTSDYPAQMLHRLYPSGKIHKASKSQFTDIYNSGKPFFMLAIIKLDSKSHHATLSKHKIMNYKNPAYIQHYGKVKNMIVYNGKVLRCENAVVMLNDVDIKAYEKIYKIKIVPISMYYFDGYNKISNWLKSCIIDDYTTKSKLKIAGLNDTVEYADSKRNVNSYYGVCATKPSEMFDEFSDDGLFTNSKECSYKEMTWNCWLNPYIAFWCTSYARDILMTFISKYPDYIVQYDTDSLYYLSNKKGAEALTAELKKYNAEITAKNKRIFKDHPDKDLFMTLGTWDFETNYINFLAMGAKKYIKQDKVNGIQTVIAGLPKSSIPAEIANRHIKKPFDHYNSLKKYISTDGADRAIVIKHHYANKFASVYNDSTIVSRETITDYMGNSYDQLTGCYHAIVPIDFTLAMAKDYIEHKLQLGESIAE